MRSQFGVCDRQKKVVDVVTRQLPDSLIMAEWLNGGVLGAVQTLLANQPERFALPLLHQPPS
jgi:hypothetical protein